QPRSSPAARSASTAPGSPAARSASPARSSPAERSTSAAPTTGQPRLHSPGDAQARHPQELSCQPQAAGTPPDGTPERNPTGLFPSGLDAIGMHEVGPIHRAGAHRDTVIRLGGTGASGRCHLVGSLNPNLAAFGRNGSVLSDRRLRGAGPLT